MAIETKRHKASKSAENPAKKARKGFRVGPDNLPDGPWRRKVTKIKKDLIHRAKVRKSYAKLKSQLQSPHVPDAKHTSNESEGKPSPDPESQSESEDEEEEEEEVEEEEPEKPHKPTKTQSAQPSTQLNSSKEQPQAPEPEVHPSRKSLVTPYRKDLQIAARRRAAQEERHAEMQRRRDERNRKIEDRQRFRRAVAHARELGPDGKRRLGRESIVLLEKVKRMVGQGP